jgi:alkylation response protein AidB-like acyl-CoA dehydrogenase
MLMFERLAIGSMGAGAISQPRFERLLQVARRSGAIARPVVRDQLMRMYAMETTKALVAMRVRAEVASGKSPGPGGSLGKLAGSMIAWRFRDLAFAIGGATSQAWDHDGDDDDESGRLAFDVLTSFSAGIAGGTDEIQRNIIGERVLGLPREVAVDRDLAFKDLRVGTQRGVD